MQLNLNTPVVDLAGKAIENIKQTLGQIVAQNIVAAAKGNILKIYGWGIKLQADEPLELDDADQTLFKSIIEENEQMTILIKGPVLTALKDQKCQDK